MKRASLRRRGLWAGLATLILVLLLGPGTALGRESSSEVASGPTLAQTYWSGFRYHYVAGATLLPRDSTMTWAYPGAGCLNQVAGPNSNFNIHLDLPHGSRIDYLRLYFYDTSAANNSRAWVTTYDGAGGTTDLTSVDSAGSGGYGTALSPFVNHLVDTMSTSYVLNWRANQLGNTMRLCGLRVAYRVQLSNTFLPLVLRNKQV